MAKLKIVEVKIGDLKSAEYNPRKWSDKAKADLRKSVDEFGMVDPLIVNSAPKRRNVIIGGHFRFMVAKERGDATVPVVYVSVKLTKNMLDIITI